MGILGSGGWQDEVLDAWLDSAAGLYGCRHKARPVVDVLTLGKRTMVTAVNSATVA